MLNFIKRKHKLPVKQSSRKERSQGREKLKIPVRAQKNPVRKSIPTSRNQEESEDSSEEDYRPEDDVLNPCASQTDSYDSDHECTVDSVINFNINECDFSRISCAETESHLKAANAESSKIIKKNWESKKKNDNMKSVSEKYLHF